MIAFVFWDWARLFLTRYPFSGCLTIFGNGCFWRSIPYQPSLSNYIRRWSYPNVIFNFVMSVRRELAFYLILSMFVEKYFFSVSRGFCVLHSIIPKISVMFRFLILIILMIRIFLLVWCKKALSVTCSHAVSTFWRGFYRLIGKNNSQGKEFTKVLRDLRIVILQLAFLISRIVLFSGNTSQILHWFPTIIIISHIKIFTYIHIRLTIPAILIRPVIVVKYFPGFNFTLTNSS